MKKIEQLINKYWFVIIGSVSLLGVWALFQPGFYGASDDMHMAWLDQMHKALMAGNIPPRFAPDLSFGFGYPLFNFVFPLPFYIAEVFHLMGLGLVDSIKTVFLLSLPLSMIFMYKLVNKFTIPSLSLAAALIYGFTPYRATDIYVRGAIGEIVAFIFLPLILFSLTTLFRQKKSAGFLKWICVSSLSIALLVLTHNITAYMFIAAVLMFVLIYAVLNKQHVLHMLLPVLLLSFLASAYFWIPAIVESSLMKYDTVFNFIDHFPTIKQLFTPFFGYGASVAGPYDGMSFFMGSVNIILLLIAPFSYLFLRRKISSLQKTILLWAGMVILVSLFLMNHRSAFVWDNVPFLAYFQFPWRFLTLTTLSTSLLVIALDSFKYKTQAALALIVLALGLNYTFFRPQDFLGRQDDYYINRYIPVPVASWEYLQTGEEYLRLPKTTPQRPTANLPILEISNGYIQDLEQPTPLRVKAELVSPQGGKVNFNRYLYPGWIVMVNGERVSLQAGIPHGQIEFRVSAGNSLVEIYLQETLTRKILNIVSLLTLIFLIKGILFPAALLDAPAVIKKRVVG